MGGFLTDYLGEEMKPWQSAENGAKEASTEKSAALFEPGVELLDIVGGELVQLSAAQRVDVPLSSQRKLAQRPCRRSEKAADRSGACRVQKGQISWVEFLEFGFDHITSHRQKKAAHWAFYPKRSDFMTSGTFSARPAWNTAWT